MVDVVYDINTRQIVSLDGKLNTSLEHMIRIHNSVAQGIKKCKLVTINETEQTKDSYSNKLYLNDSPNQCRLSTEESVNVPTEYGSISEENVILATPNTQVPKDLKIVTEFVTEASRTPFEQSKRVMKELCLLTDMEHFTAEEVIDEEAKYLLNKSDCKHSIHYNRMSDPELSDIDMGNSNFKIAFKNYIALRPNEHATFNKDILLEPTKKIKVLYNGGLDVYINNNLIEDVLTLEEPLSEVVVTVKNNTSESMTLDYIVLGYY